MALEVIFGNVLMVAVAIACTVVALTVLVVVGRRFIQGRGLRAWVATVATATAIATVTYGYLAFTFWALYHRSGAPWEAPLSQWFGFAAVNFGLALVGGLIGGALAWGLGLVIAVCTRRG